MNNQTAVFNLNTQVLDFPHTARELECCDFGPRLGLALQRPNRISDPNDFANRSATEFFNVAAFTAAPQFTIGNSSRNPIRGPGLQNADLMLGNTFQLPRA
ncbi:MAG TPA: hypothetical protein VG297_11720 [Bryobacteraceae bacterium]|nr:hypothetical protein [Bryobacteraceae bacterium]